MIPVSLYMGSKLMNSFPGVGRWPGRRCCDTEEVVEVSVEVQSCIGSGWNETVPPGGAEAKCT